MVSCNLCGMNFTRKSTLKRHVERLHSYTRPSHICVLCKKAFTNLRSFNYHKQTHKPVDTKFHLIQHGLHKTCEVYQKIFKRDIVTTGEAYKDVYSALKKFLNYKLLEKKSFKCQTILIVEFVKLDVTDTYAEDRFEFFARSSSSLITNLRSVRRFMRSTRVETELRIDDFISHGSGWRLNDVLALNVELGECKALNGGCDLAKDKKIIIKKIQELNKLLPLNSFYNVAGLHKKYKNKNEIKQNCDNKCFLQAIACFFLQKQKTKITKSNITNFMQSRLNVRIKFPVKLTSIKKFENDNSHLNLKVNVLNAHPNHEDAQSFDIHPLYVNPFKQSDNIINLLYYETKSISNNDDHKIDGHFLLIENVSHFLNTRRRSNHKFFCVNCLNGFSRRTTLKKHEKLCYQFKPQVVQAPDEDHKYVYFRNFKHQFFSHFIGFFDFEAILQSPNSNCSICPSTVNCYHKTKIEHEQIPISFSIIITDKHKKIVFQKVYTGHDCMSVFIDTLLNEIEPKLMSVLNTNIPLKWTPEDLEKYDKCTKCHICKKRFSQFRKNKKKVPDHDHLTGKLINGAHQDCNLQRQEHKKIPMFCHNFTGYDSHFIVKAFNENVKNCKLECLPYNTEKFRTINLNHFILLDSSMFLNASLDTLSCELKQLKETSNFNYPFLDQVKLYEPHEQDKKELILRKSFFPYEYLSNVSVLQEKKFPCRSAFFSKLKNTHISKIDYEHAKNVYEKFRCRNFQQYMELYCLTDTTILGEIIWQFREEIMNDSNLDIW